LNILDLFSGIGGFSLAAQRAGFTIENHYASEVDKYAQYIYRKQFPGSVQLGNVCKIGNEYGQIDIITGGFPCQAFSIAGQRNGS
jgi:site-specific DNA-cytosine methylase